MCLHCACASGSEIFWLQDPLAPRLNAFSLTQALWLYVHLLQSRLVIGRDDCVGLIMLDVKLQDFVPTPGWIETDASCSIYSSLH